MSLLEAGETWGAHGLVPSGCPACEEVHLVHPEHTTRVCPACAQSELVPGTAQLTAEPEKVVPFEHSPAELRKKLEEWVYETPFRPGDLTADALLSRVTAVWWPMWLVDASVAGHWSAEAGYDYETQSSREYFDESGWKTEQVTDVRIRWEERLGTVDRRYDNVAVRSVEDHATLCALLGSTDLSKMADYTPAQLTAAAIRVPDRAPDAAWPEAEVALRQVASSDCTYAIGSQHLRNFTLYATYGDQQWTWLLLPMYASWYTDAYGERHTVLINGQTAHIGGKRIANAKKAMALSMVVLTIAAIIAGCILVVAVFGFLLPPLFAILGFLVVPILIAIFGLWPLIRARGWNSAQ